MQEEERNKWQGLAAGLSWQQQKQQQQQPDASLPTSSIPPQQQSAGGAAVPAVPAAAQRDHEFDGDDEAYLMPEMECVVGLAAPKETCCVPCGHVCMVRRQRLQPACHCMWSVKHGSIPLPLCSALDAA